jgi:hypothetical protein
MTPQLQDRPRPWADRSLFPIIMGSALPPRDPDDDDEEEEEDNEDEDTDDEPPVVREPDE